MGVGFLPERNSVATSCGWDSRAPIAGKSGAEGACAHQPEHISRCGLGRFRAAFMSRGRCHHRLPKEKGPPFGGPLNNPHPCRVRHDPLNMFCNMWNPFGCFRLPVKACRPQPKIGSGDRLIYGSRIVRITNRAGKSVFLQRSIIPFILTITLSSLFSIFSSNKF